MSSQNHHENSQALHELTENHIEACQTSLARIISIFKCLHWQLAQGSCDPQITLAWLAEANDTIGRMEHELRQIIQFMKDGA